MRFELDEIARTLLSGGAILVGWMISNFLSNFLESFKRLVTSVEELNVKVAVILNRVEGHEARITRLEEGA